MNRPTAGFSLRLLVAASLLLVSAGRAAESDSWTRFRGDQGLGVARDAEIPLEWTDAAILWKTEIEGLGHSSPVIWGDHVYLTTSIEGEVIPGAEAPVHTFDGQEFKHPDAVGADREHTMKVIALDADSGQIVWSRTAYSGRVFDDRHRASSYASPTPVADAERVYAYFGSEGVYAYDHDGEEVWQADIGDIKTVGLGVATSPVLYGELLIIQADEDSGEDSFIVALDRSTGEEVWRRPRAVQASWSTPVLVEGPGDRPQLIAPGNELVISYDPRDGSEIWRAKGLGSNVIHVPLLHGGRLILTSGYPQKVIFALPLDRTGDLGAERLWSYNKGTAYVPSNLVLGDYLYLMNDGGVLTCLDAASGEIVYEGGRFPERGRFMASPIAVGDKILMINSDGAAAFIKGGPEHEVLATNALDERVAATPAVAGGRLFVRSEKHLWAIGAPASSSGGD